MPVPDGVITSTDIYNQPVEEVVEETKEEDNEEDTEEVSS
jgi:hypothetical protein